MMTQKMNAAQETVEHIINDLQAFLNKHSADDSFLSSTIASDLHTMQTSNSREISVHTTFEKGSDQFGDYLLDRSLSLTGQSFHRGTDSLASQSIPSGIAMSSGSECCLKVERQSALTSSQTDNFVHGIGRMENDVSEKRTVSGTTDAEDMSAIFSTFNNTTATTNSVEFSYLSSSAVCSSGVGSDEHNGEILPNFYKHNQFTSQSSEKYSPTSGSHDSPQPTSPSFPLPDTRELQNSSAIPFPMIFRRSMKDPGSKQYNELVKELEEVLEKRKIRQRRRSMRGDLESKAEIAESLNSSRKFSSSMDNLSIFSNKALLNRLENHFKNRSKVEGGIEAFHKKHDIDSVEVMHEVKTDLHVSPEGSFQNVETSIESDPKTVLNNDSFLYQQGHTDTQMDVSLQGIQEVASNDQSSSYVASGTLIKVGSKRTTPRSVAQKSDILINGSFDTTSPHIHSPQEFDSFSHDMSFGSEDELPLKHISEFSSHYNKYKKYPTSSTHFIYSSSNPNVMYRPHKSVGNPLVTRINVSKSLESISKGEVMTLDRKSYFHNNQGQGHIAAWTLDRQNSSPMKTIIENFNETDPEDVPGWNGMFRTSKKHKQKGVYRSLSQRMVQKFVRAIKPKATSPAFISKAISVSPVSFSSTSLSTAQSSLQQSKDDCAAKARNESGFVVELPNHQKLAFAPISPNLVPISPGLVRSEPVKLVSDTNGTVHSHSDFHEGKLTMLPNSYSYIQNPLAAKPSAFSRTVSPSSREFSINSQSDSVYQRNASLHNDHSSSLTIELPNSHKASIVPVLSKTIATHSDGHIDMQNIPTSGSKVKRTGLFRSSSSTSTSRRQTYRPAEWGSPFTQEIGEGALPPAYGDGLYRGEEDKTATFYIDARGMTGEPSVQVDGPNSIAKCSIDPQLDGKYEVTYVPVEVGMYDVQVKWNGKEISGSPFHPKVVCTRKVQVLRGWQHYMDQKERIHLVVNEEKRIPFDTLEAGPGKMTAEVKGPRGLIPVTVDESSVGRSTVVFTPREEGVHHIHLYWSDTPLVKSPFTGYATAGAADPSKVILTGRGLKEAIVREEAEFLIDASQAGEGEPEVQLVGVRAEVNVVVTRLGGGKFRCTYIPVIPGAYLLHITWNGRQLRGSPYKVNVIGVFFPNKVVVSGEGLKGGLLGRDLDVLIDTRKAGPGELTAYCMGPTKVAHCELEDHRDGTFRLVVRPQEFGRHILQVKYGNEHVQGSPFAFKISAQPDASKVRVSGPGVEHGILATFQSRFVVETRGAGAGQLTVRIRGPKGAFQVEMYRDSQKDRTILCRYDPTETGLYIISVRWSGVDVPGSPFHVHILDTQSELEQVLQETSLHNHTVNGNFHNSSFQSSRNSGFQWHDEI